MTDVAYDRAAALQKIYKRGYISDAGISQDGLYRYWLTRDWSPLAMTGSMIGRIAPNEDPTHILAANVKLTWIMFNPSTADRETDDATIRRCIGLSKAWGYGGIQVVNLFAWRATDPKEIALRVSEEWTQQGKPDAIGPANDRFIGNAVRHSALLGFPKVVCAWGALANGYGMRVKRVLDVINQGGGLPHCLGVTKGGYPRHPLYAPSTSTLISYRQ